MGIGSWLSRYVQRNLLGVFVQVEILVGVIGGSSAALLFLLFERVESFRVILYSVVLMISDLVSRVFTFDYVGALFASLLFPLLLVPHLGLIQTAFLFGIFNVMVAVWLLYAVPDAIPARNLHRGAALLVLLTLLAGFIHGDGVTDIAEANAYPGK